jgi:hypothetical protein
MDGGTISRRSLSAGVGEDDAAVACRGSFLKLIARFDVADDGEDVRHAEADRERWWPRKLHAMATAGLCSSWSLAKGRGGAALEGGNGGGVRCMSLRRV